MNTTCRGILPTRPDSIKINDHTIELDRKEELRLNDEPQEVIDRVFTVTNEWDEVYTITFREYVNEPTLLFSPTCSWRLCAFSGEAPASYSGKAPRLLRRRPYLDFRET